MAVGPVVAGRTESSRLSSEASRCARSRGLVLEEIFRNRLACSEIAGLFDDVTFLRDFCGVSDVDAVSVRERLRGKTWKAGELGDFVQARAMAFRFPFSRKLSGIWRRTKVFGSLHFASYLWERVKRGRLAG